MIESVLAARVRQRFNDVFVPLTALPAASFAYQNVPFEEPEESSWVRLDVLLGESTLAEFGGGPSNRRFRNVGVAMISIFTKIGIGSGTSERLVDNAMAVFRGVTSNEVKYQVPSVTVVGRSGKWWQVNVDCPFHGDDFA